MSKVMLIPTTDKHEEYNAVLASTITNTHRYKSAVVIRLNNVVSYHIECANEDSAKSILSSMILNWQIALESEENKDE